MTRARALLLEPLYHPAGEARLRECCEVQVLVRPDRSAVLEAVRDVHAICARYPHRVDAVLLDAAPDLMIVASSGRGTDAIDVAAATARGVTVVNNPGFGPIPVSELAVGFMIALARDLFRLDRQVRLGSGWSARELGTVADIDGRTIGIVGLGAIGSEMARKCNTAFHMEVLCYDPYISADTAAARGARRVDTLDELLGASDFVSLHPELNDETRGMIGERELQRMKKTAFLINSARGKIVQQAALVRALKERWIAGAALDVYEDEPLGPGNPLYDCDNIILSPHVGALSTDAVRGMSLSAATQILDALAGKRPAHALNPEAWAAADARRQRLGLAIENRA